MIRMANTMASENAEVMMPAVMVPIYALSGFDQTDGQTTDHGARDGTNAAEHGGDERLQAQHGRPS